jgi:hypothetical protein
MNTFITKINETFANVVKDYVTFISKCNNLNTLIDSNILDINDLFHVSVSLSDIAVQLQNINFKLDSYPIQPISNDNDTNDTKAIENTYNNILSTETNINKTCKDLLPIFMLYLMMIDKDSILNSNTFGNQTPNETSPELRTSPEAKTSYTFKNILQNIQLQNYNNPDDLD